MYIYWPVVLVGLSVATFFMPAPYFYHRARKWFLYSNWRLLLAGIYPVEFRDFFLGDMFCSLTYALGNVELFFCLYSQHWQDQAMCNSSHSRLLGFFTTLPGMTADCDASNMFRLADVENVQVSGALYSVYDVTMIPATCFRTSSIAENTCSPSSGQ